MDAMFEGRTMWIFRDKELCRVHPRREALIGSVFDDEVDEKGVGGERRVERV